MAKVTVHVWHNANDGQIVAIGMAPVDATYKTVPITGHGQSVLEMQVEEDSIRTLHETHRVNIHNKTLDKAPPRKT
jgi:hypothetical protein